MGIFAILQCLGSLDDEVTPSRGGNIRSCLRKCYDVSKALSEWGAMFDMRRNP